MYVEVIEMTSGIQSCFRIDVRIAGIDELTQIYIGTYSETYKHELKGV